MHYQCRILLPQRSYFKANFKNPYLTIILRTNPKHNFKGERTYTFFHEDTKHHKVIMLKALLFGTLHYDLYIFVLKSI